MNREKAIIELYLKLERACNIVPAILKLSHFEDSQRDRKVIQDRDGAVANPFAGVESRMRDVSRHAGRA